MDQELKLFELVQRIAALEVQIDTNKADIHGIGELTRATDASLHERLKAIETSVTRAQVFIAAIVSVLGIVAAVIQFALAATGISIMDIISLGGKK